MSVPIGGFSQKLAPPPLFPGAMVRPRSAVGTDVMLDVFDVMGHWMVTTKKDEEC